MIININIGIGEGERKGKGVGKGEMEDKEEKEENEKKEEDVFPIYFFDEDVTFQQESLIATSIASIIVALNRMLT